MCGRYALDENPAKLAEHFNLSGEISITPSWNIAPSTKICSITADESGSRHLSLMKWGLIPSWIKETTGNKPTNARGETVATNPMFRSAFKSHRCIIPASGFYEWKTVNGVKQPFYISLKSSEPMAFAGLWETWHDNHTCCIITTSANSLMQPIHDRMPVILSRDQWQTWLSRQERHAETVLPMIRPFDASNMQALPVSRELYISAVWHIALQ
jgi:putative SOS response-associated peptidase YedK